MKKIGLLIIYIFLFFQNNWSQTITGTVKDSENGQPLQGVSLKIKGKTQSTISEKNGQYTIHGLSVNQILIFTYVGYITQEVTFKGESVIDVILKLDINQIDEVVIIGYGTVAYMSLGCYIISEEEIIASKYRPLTNHIKAQFPSPDLKILLRKITVEPNSKSTVKNKDL